LAKDRLYVERRGIDLFRELTNQTNNTSQTSQPFTNLKDAFLWAVALGVNAGSRKPLEGAKEGLVMWDYLTDDDKKSLTLLAIADTNTLEIIGDLEIIQDIAEEYANEGLRIIKNRVKDGPGDPLWKLVNIVREK